MRKQYFTARQRNFTLRQQDFIARKRASPYLLLLFPRQRLRHEGCCSMGGIGLGAAAGCSLRTYGRGTNGSAFASGGVKRRFARSSRARPTSLFGSVSPSSALFCTGAGRYYSCGAVGSAGLMGGNNCGSSRSAAQGQLCRFCSPCRRASSMRTAVNARSRAAALMP